MLHLYRANAIGENLETQRVQVAANKTNAIHLGDIVAIGADGYGFRAIGNVNPAIADPVVGACVAIYDNSGNATLIDAFGTSDHLGAYIPALNTGLLTVINDLDARYVFSCDGVLTQTDVGNGINLMTTGDQQLDHLTAAGAAGARQFTIMDIYSDADGNQWVECKVQSTNQFDT